MALLSSFFSLLQKLCNKDDARNLLNSGIVFYEMISVLFGAKSRCYRESFSFRPRQFEGFIIYGALTGFMMPLGGQAVVLRRLLLVEVHSCILMDTSNSEFFFGAVAKSVDCLPQCSATKRWTPQRHKMRVQ